VLSDQFGFSEEDLENDPEIKNTIENLASRMNVKDMAESGFEGEYKALKDSEYLFLINLINSLKDDGIMAVSLSQGFLTKKSLETLRKYLTVKKNCIDCVITVPNEISRPRRPDVIVVFRKNKSTDDIVFIDLSEDYDVGKTRYPVSGTFKRNLTLGRKTIDKIVEVYNARQTIDKFSNVVSLRELAKNDFILSTSRYVDTFGGEFIRLEDLKDQKQKTDCRIRRLNKKINMMMDDLGIDF
jgi:type I restriction enzyme M protein